MSESSKIKEEWVRRPLRDVVDFHPGYAFPDAEQGHRDEDFPFYKVGDMSRPENGRFLTVAGNYVSEQIAKRYGWKPCPPGSVAFAKVGAALLMNRRRIIDRWSLIDNNMLAVVGRHDIHDDYLYHAMQAVDFSNFVQDGVVPSVNQSQIGDVRIWVPPIPEQCGIAEVLDTADEAIRSIERFIAKLNQVKQGLLHDLLAPGTDLPTWQSLPLSACVSAPITYGIVQAGPHVEGGVPYIRTGDMSGNRLDRETLLCTSKQIASSYARSTVHKGDIVCAIRATVGRVLIVPEDLEGANLTQGTARISPGSGIDSAYLLWALRGESVQRQFSLAVKGTTFSEITLAQLREIRVPIPQTIDEQRAIAVRIAAADDEIAQETLYLSKLCLLKRGMMDDLLTGRVRVGASA